MCRAPDCHWRLVLFFAGGYEPASLLDWAWCHSLCIVVGIQPSRKYKDSSVAVCVCERSSDARVGDLPLVEVLQTLEVLVVLLNRSPVPAILPAWADAQARLEGLVAAFSK